MVRIEPIRFNTNGESQDLDLEDTRLVFEDWTKPHTWLLNKILTDGFEIIDQNEISTVVREATSEIYTDVSETSPRIINNIVERTAMNAARAARRAPVIITKDDVIILVSMVSGNLLLVSESKEEINNIISDFDSELSNISSVSADFGIEVKKIVQGQELVKEHISKIEGERLENEGADNGLEKQVFEDLTNEVTSCADTNVEIQFNEQIYSESFEFDVICHPTPNLLIMIEVKDAIYEEKEFDKSELVRKQDEKAGLLADKSKADRVEGFVVTRDLDEQKFSEFSQMADRSNVSLLKYDEGAFVEELSQIIKQHASRQALGTGPSPRSGGYIIGGK